MVDLARVLVRAAEQRTYQPEITIDVDGALSFDLRLTSGLLMFAELTIAGDLDITILDDRGQDTFVVRHLSPATSGPAQFTPEYRALLATNCRHTVPPD